MKLSKLINTYGDVDISISNIDDYSIMLHNIRKPKEVDMSPCIESQILCQFSDRQEYWILGTLEDIATDGELPTYKKEGLNADWFNHCQPAMAPHFHANPKGWDKCPIPEGYQINFWIEDNSKTVIPDEEKNYTELNWKKILIFQIVGLNK